jgi:NDP-sugar pyrophosphorylase family protein
MKADADTARVQCIILAGGLGSRLRGVVPDRPKILAPIDDRPFIDYLIGWLMGQGIRRLVFSLGYKAEMIQAYLDVNTNPAVEIKSVVEPEPLGTAGGLILACSAIDSDPVLVLNGDSLIDIDLSAFLAAHRSKGADVSIVTVQVPDGSRFGNLEIDADDYVRAFREKDPSGDGQTGWINAGIYAFSASALEDLKQLRRGSLEHDFFALRPDRFLYAYPSHGKFIDIGSPESFSHAGDWVRDNNFRSVKR